MQPTIVRVFVSSTWLDLKPERGRVEEVLDRFKDTKFIGMERFGSHPETTRVESLREIDQCDLYLGIIGGRYGSGITEAEYDRAREKGLPCFVYFKQDQQVRPEDRDEEAERTELLVKFKAKLKDPSSGHTVAEFSGPYELASIARERPSQLARREVPCARNKRSNRWSNRRRTLAFARARSARTRRNLDQIPFDLREGRYRGSKPRRCDASRSISL